MGTRSRRKGANGEREVVHLAHAAGLPASREWQNAQHPDPTVRQCDCLVAGRRAQVKVAADGFHQLYSGLDSVDLLFVRSDRREWLVALRAKDYLELLKQRGRR